MGQPTGLVPISANPSVNWTSAWRRSGRWSSPPTHWQRSRRRARSSSVSTIAACSPPSCRPRLPVREAAGGRFLGAWSLAAVTLAVTTPLWSTINVLGHPDNGAILVAYLVALLMAGAYIAIGSAMSALTRAQVTAFVLAVMISFLFTAA